MKTAIMVIVIFKVRTRARLRKPIDERRILSVRNAPLIYRPFHPRFTDEF